MLTITSASEIPPITVPGTTAKIFVAQSDWKPLDPVVISNSPVHDATSVPVHSPIVLQFSTPMDTDSVQTNFATIPTISGTFAWSAARDRVSFTPAGAGFPADTMITIRVTDRAVDAISGRPMYSPYEMRFKTAQRARDESRMPAAQ